MRLKLTLAYVGSGYSGWQRQPDKPTVQGLLESAAARTAGRIVAVTGAGRTDAGVHAAGQAAHLDADEGLSPQEWLQALNARLPQDIRVLACTVVDPGFSARYSATRKTYRYCIDDQAVASPFLAPFAWHVSQRLDDDAMRRAAAHLIGPVDQSAFATRSDKEQTIRPIDAVVIDRDRLLGITVIGRSFLRYAVRGMVGTLVEVGRGRRDPDSLRELVTAGDRSAAGATAPAHGLCLVRIDYDDAAAR